MILIVAKHYIIRLTRKRFLQETLNRIIKIKYSKTYKAFQTRTDLNQTDYWQRCD